MTLDLCFEKDFFTGIKQQTNDDHLEEAAEEAAACVWIFSVALIAATNWFFTLGRANVKKKKTIQSRAKNTEEIRQFALINENIPWFVGTQRRP